MSAITAIYILELPASGPTANQTGNPSPPQPWVEPSLLYQWNLGRYIGGASLSWAEFSWLYGRSLDEYMGLRLVGYVQGLTVHCVLQSTGMGGAQRRLADELYRPLRPEDADPSVASTFVKSCDLQIRMLSYLLLLRTLTAGKSDACLAMGGKCVTIDI